MATSALKSFRDRHGLTQKMLGLLLGIEEDNAQGRVSHYEKGRREIPLDIAWKLIDLAQERGETLTLEEIFPRDQTIAA